MQVFGSSCLFVCLAMFTNVDGSCGYDAEILSLHDASNCFYCAVPTSGAPIRKVWEAMLGQFGESVRQCWPILEDLGGSW